MQTLSFKTMNDELPNKKGLGLGIFIIAILIFFLFFDTGLGPFGNNISTLLTGIYLQIWGILFLLSYYYSHKTFFLRGLIWICENFTFPRSRMMAFFYFILLFGIGTIAVLYGVGSISSAEVHTGHIPQPSQINPIENWWYKDPILYIVIAILIVGAYYKTKINKR